MEKSKVEFVYKNISSLNKISIVFVNKKVLQKGVKKVSTFNTQ